MSKVLAFARVGHRPAQTGAPVQPPQTNPAQLWIDGHKPGASRLTYAYYLCAAARLLGYGDGVSNTDYARCPWWCLGYTDVENLRTKLLTKVADGTYTAATANLTLSSVKGVMEVVWRMGVDSEVKYLTAEALMVIQKVKSIPGKKLRHPRRHLTDAEFAQLIEVCKTDISAQGLRDLAIIGVAGMAGPRASEMVALALADYDAARRQMRMPQIKVDTDEDEIWQPLEPPVTTWLDAWIAVRGTRPGALFSRLERGGVGAMTTLHPTSITDIVARRGHDAGVEGVTCHVLRRYFVTWCSRRGIDLSMAARLVRHSSTETTARYYIQSSDEDKRDAIKQLPFPGRDTT